MAVTISLYNHTAKLFANGDVTLAGLKFMLTNNYTFAATETVLTNPTAAEVDGNGWDTGGEAIGSAAVTVVTTNDAKLDGSDISVTASGGAIGPADGGVIHDGTYPLAYVDFGEEKTADSGTPFNVVFNASGILTWTVT